MTERISPRRSPATPVKINGGQMDFYSALRVMMDGKRVTRAIWEAKKVYGFLDDTLMIHLSDNIDHPWIVSREDIEGKDWIAILVE